MTSITYWNRLIPQPLDTSLERGLAAEVRDLAWTLARQLQFGEFLGADGVRRYRHADSGLQSREYTARTHRRTRGGEPGRDGSGGTGPAPE